MKKESWKKVIIYVMVLVLVLGLTACSAPTDGSSSTTPGSAGGGDSQDTDAPIILGYIGSLTGPYQVFGDIGRSASQIAVDHINQDGGILGREVILKVYDNQGEPVETTNVARKAILEDGVMAFVGPDSSASLLTLYEVCEEYKIPTIAYASSSANVTQNDDGSPRAWRFRVNLAAHQSTGVMAKYAAEELGLKRFAALYDVTHAAAIDGIAQFENGLKEGGGELLFTEGYKTNDVDFRAQLASIKAKSDQIDAIYIPANYTELGLIANQVKEMGIEQVLIGDRGWMMEDVFKVCGDNLNGSYFNSDIDPNAQRFAEFIQEFDERFGEGMATAAGTDAFFCYDAFLVLKNGFEQAGSTDAEAVRSAIENQTVDLPVLTTNITIVPETHNCNREMSIFRIEGQKYVRLEDYRVDIG